MLQAPLKIDSPIMETQPAGLAETEERPNSSQLGIGGEIARPVSEVDGVVKTISKTRIKVARLERTALVNSSYTLVPYCNLLLQGQTSLP